MAEKHPEIRTHKGRDVVDVRELEGWHDWLEQHVSDSPAVWLFIGKKGNSVSTLTYEQARDEALAFGWIDGLVNAWDDDRYLQLMSPRKPGSTWSKTNKTVVERLAAEGRLSPAGAAVIERAKADGTWTMLDDVDNVVVPPDLAAALDSNPAAKAHFEAFPDSAKRQILYWIVSTKVPATRKKRIAESVEAAAAGERLVDWRAKHPRG